jgi:hypothetical protein
MRRASRSNLILLGLVVLLGLAAWWQVEREVAGFEPPLSTLDVAAIRRIEVNCLQCQRRLFERDGALWTMREPYVLPADQAVVARLLSIAHSPVRRRHALDAFEAAKVGLAPPLMSLDLDDTHFDIGLTDALGGDRYVRTGDRIAMVPDRFSPFLVAAPESELDRHLVPRGSTLTSLRIDGSARADLVETWTDAQAARLLADADGGDAATGTLVELRLADGSTVEFTLVAGTDGPVLRRTSPRIRYMLTPGQADALLGTPLPASP